MTRGFSETMSELRKKRGASQRTAAADLGISQALLSHYENGAREPGLSFVCRACDYYGVSADYLLGRTDDPSGAASPKLSALAEQLRALAESIES
jgi:transcriptional regulator with XRE-family HTH domain